MTDRRDVRAGRDSEIADHGAAARREAEVRGAARMAAALRGAELQPPSEVVDIVRTLEEAGHESWCVGGAVRDALLGMRHLDWDIATAATPQQVRRLFKRTIPIGIDFGTVGVVAPGGRMHEVTTFRRDVQTDGRHAVVEFGASLDEDLDRRDLTINAIAYHPLRGLLHDPHHGAGDLELRLVRAVGIPRQRMREDRLRALRAIRFAARFGFVIEAETWEAVVGSAPHLGRLSPERVKQELDKTFEQVARPGRALRMWRESGALGELIPSLARLDDETLRALDCLPRSIGRRAAERRVIAYAVLFADLAPALADRAMKALRFSNAERRAVGRLVALQGELGGAMAQGIAGGAGDATLRRWIATAGRTEMPALVRALSARWRAREAGPPVAAPQAVHELHRRLLRISYRDPVSLADLAVSGDDLRAAGISPGPQMARILHGLLDAVLEEPGRNRVDDLLARARALASPHDASDSHTS